MCCYDSSAADWCRLDKARVRRHTVLKNLQLLSIAIASDWSVFQFDSSLSPDVNLAEITKSFNGIFTIKSDPGPRWWGKVDCTFIMPGPDAECALAQIQGVRDSHQLSVFMASSLVQNEQRREARNNWHVTHEIVPHLPPSSTKELMILWFTEVTGQLSCCRYFRFVVPRTRKMIRHRSAQSTLPQERHRAEAGMSLDKRWV